MKLASINLREVVHNDVDLAKILIFSLLFGKLISKQMFGLLKDAFLANHSHYLFLVDKEDVIVHVLCLIE